MNPPNRRNPALTTSGQTTRLVALVAPPGEEVTDEHRSREWEVQSVQQTAGGQGDTATLIRRLDRAGRMRNRTISELRPQAVEIWTVDAKTNELDLPVFWGEMDTRSLNWSGGEYETAVAAVRPFHFGEPLRGMQVWDERTDAVVTIEHDAEFNPRVDGKLCDNMMQQRAVDDFPDYNLWFPPESSRTFAAMDQHGPGVSPLPWTLARIVRTLCGMLNWSETHILNYQPTPLPDPVPDPPPDDDMADAPAVKNITLRRGQWLPQLLDALMPAFGFGWYLSYEKQDPFFGSVRVKPRITVYQRGKGPEKKLYVPKIDKHITLQHTVDKPDLTADLFQLANQVRCEGAVVEREVTMPLYRAWPESDDDIDLDDLTKSAAESPNTAAHGVVWRKWVANEAGDYCETRTAVHAIPSVAPNLDPVFGAGNWIVRRRFMDNCLTWEDAEKTRRKPVQVEWSDDSGSSWQPVQPGWGVRVLQDEIGVMFTGDAPPEELYAAGANARVRITGTIQGDKRLVYTSEREEGNPQSNVVELVLDVSDQFYDRARVDAPNNYFSVLTGDADERDDTSLIEAFADTVKSQRHGVVLQANISLFGIHFDYQIGDILTELTGRDIKLNRLPQGLEGRYLQVVGRTFDVAGQRTTLTVTPYDR